METYETHVAERIRVYVDGRLSERSVLRGKVEADAARDAATCSMILALESYMLAEHRDTVEVHECWPATWWDAFKDRWFPRWLRSRFPVEWRSVDVSQRIYGPVCPHLHVPERGKHLQWTAMEELPT